MGTIVHSVHSMNSANKLEVHNALLNARLQGDIQK